MAKIAVGVWAIFGLMTTILAQPIGGQNDQYPQAPAISIRASIWGQVNHPGQYSFNSAADLFELISAAGGPTSNADVRHIIVLREKDGTRHRFNLQHLALSGQRFFLATGDVVIIPESFWSKFRNGLPVITTAAAVANVAITAILLSQR